MKKKCFVYENAEVIRNHSKELRFSTEGSFGAN
jgi:hypothetical protein